MEPDFEELIDDYILDGLEDEPPPPPDYYDEDEWEEAAGAAATSLTATGTGATTAVSAPLRVFPSPEPQEAVSEDDDEHVETSAARIREVWAHKRQRTDPYAFERYNEDRCWREEAVDSPNAAMRATKWKKPSKPKPPTVVRPLFGLELTDGSQAHKKEQPFSLSQSRALPDTVKLCCTYRPRPGETSVSLTCRNGSRLYVRVMELPPTDRLCHRSPDNSSSSLLGVPMSELMRRVQAARRQREHDQLKRALARSVVEHDGVDRTHLAPPPVKDDGHLLWVDKYAPSSFAHLLSDERTNREVVRALRAWDPYVFRRDAPPARSKDYWAHPPHRADNSGGNSRPPPSKSANDTKSPHRDLRPDASSRVVLLSGPPGIGKTTLAHILARHVGYHPLEVNGSDDRTAQALRERVVALESDRLAFTKGGNGKCDRRPNCLILDEIDGADARGAIAALVELVRAEIPSHSSGTSTAGSARRKSSLAPYLRRPIILICNNRYEPALRPLLPYCRHFALNPPSESRLASRLRECLNREGMTVSSASVLHQLVAVACGDVRSCLHTLQFAAARAREEDDDALLTSGGEGGVAATDISRVLLEALSGGHKDSRNDFAGTLTTVFRKSKGGARGTAETPPASVDTVLEAVQAFGDHGHILDGLFVNILGVSYIDPTLDKCSATHRWLSDFDLFRNVAEAYVPAAAGAVHLLCRVEQRPDLVFSTRAFADAHYRTEANRALVGKFADGLSPQAASIRSNGCAGLVTEVIPYALWILSAGEGSAALDRPVATYELLNKGEMASFQRHLDGLKSLGLSYRVSIEDKGEPGQRFPRLQLEPPIDQLTQFEGLHIPQERTRREIAPSMKQLLAQRAVHQNMRILYQANEGIPKLSQDHSKGRDGTRAEAKIGKSGSSLIPDEEYTSSTVVKRSTSNPQDSSPPAKRIKKTTQNFLQIGARKAKESKTARNAARVGFLRTEKVKLSNTGSGVPLSQVIRLKYVKGFTEAVRTPCTLKDLR